MPKPSPTARACQHEPKPQNIPIRTEMGDEIRRTFVGEQPLAVGDYSELERRIMDALKRRGGEPR